MSKEQFSGDSYSLFDDALEQAVNGDLDASGIFIETSDLLKTDSHDPLRVIERQVFEKQLHAVLSRPEDQTKVHEIFDRAKQEQSKPKGVILHFPTDRFKKPGLEGDEKIQ